MPVAPADYRRGIAPLRTASQLATLLPVPLMMIFEGYAKVLFPGSTPSTASPYVAIVQTRPKPSFPDGRVSPFPIYVNGVQWQQVVVPILAPILEPNFPPTGAVSPEVPAYRWRGTIGSVGQALDLLQDVIGPGGEIAFAEGTDYGYSATPTDHVARLYGCDASDLLRVGGRTASYLVEVSALVQSLAEDAGY